MNQKQYILFYGIKAISFFVALSLLSPINAVAKMVSDTVRSATYYQPIAMVNDSPITPIDIEKRADFLRIINNIPDTVALTPKDKSKILDDLIEEKIKFQETERFKIKIDDSRINIAFKSAAASLNLSEQEFSTKLLRFDIDRIYFDKVTSDKMAWEELVQGRYGRDITVSTYEVAQIIEANALTDGLSIIYNQILIPFDSTQKAKSTIQETLESIAQRLEKGEAFVDIAKNYNPNSVSKTQLLSEIPPELAQNLLNLQTEQISRPVRIGNNIVIAQFIDKQKGNKSVINQKMTIKSGRLDLGDVDSPQEKQALIQKLNNNPNLCKDYDDYLEDITVFDNTTIGELPESLRAVAKAAKQGETRIVREAKDSDYVLTICNIKKPDYYNDVSPEIRNKTRNQIFTHKLALKDKEYYRDLKKYAVITIFQ